MTDIKSARILIMVTHGFEKSELEGPRDQLRQAGATVKIATPDGRSAKSWHDGQWGPEAEADLTIAQVRVANFDALVLPGGQMNPDSLRLDDQAIMLVRDFVAAGKTVAAICHAPWLLIDAAAVEGRTMTSWPSVRKDLENAGAKVVDCQVATDNGIVTSRKPEDVDAFVAKIIEEIQEGPHQRDAA